MKAGRVVGFHEERISLVHPTLVQRGHGIGSFLGGLFRKIPLYLSKGARAIGKKALCTGINVIEDVENNIPLKETIKTWESRENLKKKNRKENM